MCAPMAVSTQELCQQKGASYLPAVGEVQVSKGGEGSQLDQAGVSEVPAVAGLQVLQRGKPRAVLQRRVRQPLVALPAAS